MNKFTAALLATALVAPTLAAAPAMAQMHQGPGQDQRQDQRHDNDRDRGHNAGPGKQSYRDFRKGQKFDRRYARNYQTVDYRKYRGVKAPPRGYHYVRSGNDMLLVGITSGIVASVLAGQFR
jgi:Ni/Co efflux regulator RcnB